MSTRFRIPFGLVALAAGLWVLTPTTAAPPALPKDAYAAAAKADVAFLQAKLAAIVANPNMNKGAMKTIKASALMLAVDAEADGDAALQAQALAIAAAATKKDWAAAEAAAKGMAPKGGAVVAVDKKMLEGTYKMELEEVMSPFRVGKAGGMNLESDLKGALKAGTIDPKDATLIGTRTAAIGVFTPHFPNDKGGASPAAKKKWDQYTADMVAASKELADEAAKPKADTKAMVGALKKIDTSCVRCHGDFRDD